MSGGIEASIFSQVENATGESFDDFNESTQTDETVKDSGSDLEQDQLEQQLRQDQQKQPVDTKPADPRKAGDKGKSETRLLRQDEKGNLVDGEGNVVVEAGKERKLATRVQQLSSLTNQLRQREQDLLQQVAETKALNGLPQQLGLNNDEVLQGLQVIVSLKTNPADAAKKAIEIALSRGANLRDIVNDELIPNLSLGGVKQLLDERLGPIVGNQRQQEQVAQVEREALAQAQQFFTDYPDAQLHQDVVAQQVVKLREGYAARGQSVPNYILAEMAWNQIQSWADQNRFDLSQPLAPQWQARQTQQPQTPRNGNQKPFPNGSTGGNTRSATRVAGAEESTDAIVRQAMRESGYQV